MGTGAAPPGSVDLVDTEALALQGWGVPPSHCVAATALAALASLTRVLPAGACALILAASVYTRLVPAGSRATDWFSAPLPLAAGQVAVPVAAQVQAPSSMLGGSGSVTVNCDRSPAPLLRTVTV
ncbi:hypothetical protein D3C72_1971240 [compost metagenome]